jgi:hypothetical protein
MMNESSQPVCTLQHLYTTSAPIFANGMMHMFGFIQCTSGISMLLVAPTDADKVICPLCGQIHLIKDAFIPMNVDEFVAYFQQGNLSGLRK